MPPGSLLPRQRWRGVTRISLKRFPCWSSAWAMCCDIWQYRMKKNIKEVSRFPLVCECSWRTLRNVRWNESNGKYWKRRVFTWRFALEDFFTLPEDDGRQKRILSGRTTAQRATVPESDDDGSRPVSLAISAASGPSSRLTALLRRSPFWPEGRRGALAATTAASVPALFVAPGAATGGPAVDDASPHAEDAR